MRLLLLPLALVGCAKASSQQFGNRTDAGLQPRPDSGMTHPPIDAFVSHVDAPPGQMVKTLDENTSDTLASGVSIACVYGTSSGDPFGDTGPASYYRVFDLAAFGVTADFHVSQISFQVDDCATLSGNGTTVTAKVGKYVGTGGNTLALADLQMLAQDTNVAVPEGAGSTVNVPLNATIPTGGKLFVEVDSSDGFFDHAFYLGANSAGESAPSYMMSTNCGTNVPTAIATFYTTTPVDLLMTVTGSY